MIIRFYLSESPISWCFRSVELKHTISHHKWKTIDASGSFLVRTKGEKVKQFGMLENARAWQ